MWAASITVDPPLISDQTAHGGVRIQARYSGASVRTSPGLEPNGAGLFFPKPGLVDPLTDRPSLSSVVPSRAASPNNLEMHVVCPDTKPSALHHVWLVVGARISMAGK
jgi:hypothetical protein